MNIIDLLIVLMALSAVIRGRELGFARQLGSTVGFIAGIFLGVALQPFMATLVTDQISRSFISLFTIIGTAFLLLGIGEYIGIRLKTAFHNTRFNAVDGWFGSLIGTGTLLIAVWLGAAILNIMPFPAAQQQIRDSQIISRLNQSLPPSDTVISNLGNLLTPNDFPRVFIGTEPAPRGNTTIPGVENNLQQAVNVAKESVVKIEGIGCGGIVEGSGFVINGDLVITNAHVVAGVARPFIRDANGQHTATPVWFDPDLDFAIVRADNLSGGPLLINPNLVDNNTRGAVLGYPGGGPLTAGGAGIVDHFSARGRDIYNQSISTRQIYSLAARVVPGNSGGPVIAADGRIIGVVFAQSTTNNNIGYALSTPQLLSAINQAQAQNRTVSTGQCAQG